jgi:hypothetical protein
MARIVKKESEGSYDDEIKSLLQDQPEDACTLQVIGLSDYVQPGLFQEAFRIQALQTGIGTPTVVSVVMEDNHVSLNQCTVKEMYIEFKTEHDACYVLGLKSFDLRLPVFGLRHVEFRKPIRNSASRAAYRKYRELKMRDSKIQAEYQLMGAIRNHAGEKPVLPSLFQNKSFFMELLPALERKRKAGHAFNMHDLTYLKTHQLKDTDKLNAQINALYKEECYIWLELRKYELAGLKI